MPKGDNSATPVRGLGSGTPAIRAVAAGSAAAATGSAAAAAVSAAAAAMIPASDQGATSRSPAKVAQVQGSLTKPHVAVPKGISRAGSEQGTDGEPSPDTQLTLREEIRLFRSELREVRDEMREFRREMAGLHSAMGVCTQRVDSLEARILSLETKQSVALPDNKVSHLEHIVGQLQLELNDREQDLLSADLEISNIPDIPGENVVHTVGLVAAKLGVTLEERDIVFAQRVGLRMEREAHSTVAGTASPAGATTATARGRRIVVRLTRRAVRDELLQGARMRRGATTADFGLAAPPRRFFLNERLTRTNKHLFYRVREAGGRLGWRYTWTKNGRILAKQGDGKPTQCIRTMEDLTRVFGQDISAEKDV